MIRPATAIRQFQMEEDGSGSDIDVASLDHLSDDDDEELIEVRVKKLMGKKLRTRELSEEPKMIEPQVSQPEVSEPQKGALAWRLWATFMQSEKMSKVMSNPIPIVENATPVEASSPPSGVKRKLRSKVWHEFDKKKSSEGKGIATLVSAIYQLKDNPDKYVIEWYKVEKMRKAYEHFLVPINGEKLWPRPDLHVLLPPTQRRMPSRPKKCRRNEPNEET
ncbi:hypothetical protein IFM89_031620 [Coptis chinensis]|uniref:Uncharacterized protein n=1 Tax=Coptis chinensis TaxID=261450 RepID=A0A835LJ92_9MAGN|nr:hypothetical protein IFM89_031620 [Coptis chinensis]